MRESLLNINRANKFRDKFSFSVINKVWLYSETLFNMGDKLTCSLSLLLGIWIAIKRLTLVLCDVCPEARVPLQLILTPDSPLKKIMHTDLFSVGAYFRYVDF